MNTRDAKNEFDDISYRLLEAFSKESAVSQRALADHLGIALGLVNAYIKRLYKKGYIKIKFLPKNRIKYMLTPQGLTEKTKLTYKFMHYSILYFKNIRQKIEHTYTDMVKAEIKKILLWGDGELAELCYISTRGFSLEIIGAVGKKRHDNAFFDRHVYAIEDIHDLEYDALLISMLDIKDAKILKDLGVSPEKIFYLER
ncbi:MAG: winged helix-turn-helix transcriptional regulator [Pseudomonadota bacterium]